MTGIVLVTKKENLVVARLTIPHVQKFVMKMWDSRPPRKRRPSTDSSPRIERDDDDVIPTDYVDYKPLIDKSDRPEDNTDESRNFDDV